MASRTHILSGLRRVFRMLRPLPCMQPHSPLRRRLLFVVRQSLAQQDEAEMERTGRCLKAYAECVMSVQELVHLRALDTGEKMTQSERVKAMARRVGLRTPEEYEDEDKSSEKDNKLNKV